MLGLPRLVLGVAVAAVAVGGAAYVLFSSEPPAPAEACTQSGCLREAGFSEDFVELACTSTTQFVANENGRYRYIQLAPALDLRRDLLIAVADRTFNTLGASSMTTARGESVYPLRREVRPFEGGHHLIQSFFVRYDTTDPARART